MKRFPPDNMRSPVDYSRDDDYDPEGAEWTSLNMLHSRYDQEIDVRTGAMRHREWGQLRPWKEGRAPT